jgi:Cytochrome c
VTTNRPSRERVLVVGLALLALLAGAVRAAAPSAKVGESIYLHGVLGSGAPLQGVRQAGGINATGAQAACVNCHQRSGLGSNEGHLRIPPISGPYLFHAREATSKEPILPYVEWMHGNRDPYTDATLARAIREGVDSQGRPLKDLMPHFGLNDSDMAALIDYLKSLNARPVPGVTDTVLHFATVITPDADPVKRRGMLDVMEHYFVDKNQFPIGPSAQMRTSGKTEYAKSMFMSHRLWKLHVWELTGPASTWRGQLEQDMAKEPVLAVVSGLGGSNWAPVHDFCERAGLPCLFPNVEVPVDDSDFYPLYFSKGVLLEAELIAQAIGRSDASGSAAIVQQVYRAGDSGEAAAQALAAALKKRGIEARSQVLAAGPAGRGVAEALRAASTASVLVLWLRPSDLAQMGDASAAPASVYVSGLMGGLERSPLPQGWRSRVRMAYPLDLPEHRDLRLRYALNWFSIKHIPVVDEQVQANTYLACGLLAETLSHMADNFVQPFMVELLQSSIERRLINTGYYPRMALGWNQHFASKGGYIVSFPEPSGTRLVADSDWTVP